jgi:hypothetical protein
LKNPPLESSICAEWVQEDFLDGEQLLNDPTFKGFVFPNVDNPPSPEDSAKGFIALWIHEKVSAIGIWLSRQSWSLINK